MTNYGAYCEFHKNAIAAYTPCKQRADNKQDLNTNYNWSCNPEFDGDNVKHDSKCNIWCDCSGTIIDKTIYHA
jgi:hypothetical protein